MLNYTGHPLYDVGVATIYDIIVLKEADIW